MPDLVEWVNLLQGTDSSHTFSNGNTLPLISLPFGMTSWSLQTEESCRFFHPSARQFQGLRATHQPSPWIGDYGHFTLMPQVGRRFLQARTRASAFRPDQMTLQPHYVKLHLMRYQTILELTPTERCAYLRLTFPEAESPRIILQPFDGQAYMRIDPQAGSLCGYTRGNSGGVPPGFACYFVATLDCPLQRSACGLFQDQTAWEGEMQRTGERLGAYLGLRPTSGRVVHLRLGTSFISIEQAQRNMEREIGSRSFDQIRRAAHQVWQEHLSTVTLEGATPTQSQTFYSALYRTLLFPRRWYEYDATHTVVHYSPYDGQIHTGILYADNGFWDTHRTVYPLFAILFPEHLRDILAGWITAYQEGGWFPKWSSPGYRDCMIGTHIDAVIADAYVKGIDFDVKTAYQGLRKHAFTAGPASGFYGRKGLDDYMRLGYVPADAVPASVSRTLDFAYNDFCIAQVARGLKQHEDDRRLRARAFSYRQVYDPHVGFMHGRNRDGSWQRPFDPLVWGGPYVEGAAWQCSWAVPHDAAGLITLMGGRDAFIAKLDAMLATPPHFEVGTYNVEIHEMTEMAVANFGQYAHSNQPCHHVLYLYAAAGVPDKTQYWVRKVLDELYAPTPDGLPGDEDNGEMSAWYILSACGLYPLCPGHPSYVFGSPLFPRVTLQVAGGNRFVIEARHNAPQNVYVNRLELNGQPYAKSFISHQQVVSGGHLTFYMSPIPNTTPWVQKQGLPFSLSTELARSGP